MNIPPIPDNQPMEIALESLTSRRVEEHHVSSITGKLKEKVTESECSHHPQMAGTKGSISACAVQGCDGKVMTDERGLDILPCKCGYKICRDCYSDALRTGEGICPGCKENNYKEVEMQEVGSVGVNQQLPPGFGVWKRKLGSQTNEFDNAPRLFETRGSYGYENAMWPKGSDNGASSSGSSSNSMGGNPNAFRENPSRPLTQELSISVTILSLYRFLMLVRLVSLSLFLKWRVENPNDDAPWLWGMSVVCEIWFAITSILDHLPKLFPINRVSFLDVLKEKFETRSMTNPTGKSDLPGIDVFVSTADPEKEPPLVTANTILSMLAADYPVEKLSCYVSDDSGSLWTFEALAEAATFAKFWVPFCRKHDIEPRNPESYFSLKRDPYKNKVRPDFVRDRRQVEQKYDEFKVKFTSLRDSIRRRCDYYNSREETKAMELCRENGVDEQSEISKIPRATWMSNGTPWLGTWTTSAPDHSRGDHSSIIQVLLEPPSDEPLTGTGTESDSDTMNLTKVDIRLPMLVYISREKRPGYDHNKKAGAMNALVRASAIMSNGPFVLNLDCDHYIYNSQALREGMCFMMDRGGEGICYVQFPQRFEGIDPSDRYANHNTVFFDGNMRALDGIQGPFYVGTGCLFRRTPLYGFDPPLVKEETGWFGSKNKKLSTAANVSEAGSVEEQSLRSGSIDDIEMNTALIPKKFGNSELLVDSIRVAECQGKPLADHESIKHGRRPGELLVPRDPLDAATVAEAIHVISCGYEDKTEWGLNVGWIYGSVTEDVVTGYRMHNRGWKSVYCVTKRDAFRGTAPINLTDRLHQVLRWATGSVEIFFSRNNALLASSRLKFLQRIAYLNVGIYPFTSFFLIVYCFLPAASLFSGQFIVQTIHAKFLAFLLGITVTLILLALLEIKWSGIRLEEWWRNEQFWLIGGTSAHLAAVIQGLLKITAGIEIPFNLTSKSSGDDENDEFADLHVIKLSWIMIPPLTIMMVNVIAIVVAVTRTIYSYDREWNSLIGGVFFSFWVLAHLYPFALGLMGRRGRTSTVVYLWSASISIILILFWVAINPPSGNNQIGGSFQFP